MDIGLDDAAKILASTIQQGMAASEKNLAKLAVDLAAGFEETLRSTIYTSEDKLEKFLAEYELVIAFRKKGT